MRRRFVITLGRTLKKRGADVLAYFDRPGTSNGPTEAINGRLEHLRGSALGFRNLTNYIARSLLESGGFRPQLHPGCEEPVKWPEGLPADRSVKPRPERASQSAVKAPQEEPGGQSIGATNGDQGSATPGPPGPPKNLRIEA